MYFIALVSRGFLDGRRGGGVKGKGKTDKTGKREFAQQQVGRALVAADLLQRERAGLVAVGLRWGSGSPAARGTVSQCTYANGRVSAKGEERLLCRVVRGEGR